MSAPSRPMRPVVWFMLAAFLACAIAIASGFFSALSYTEGYAALNQAGVTLQHLRPIHETFGTAWIYLGAAMIVHFFLIESTGPFSGFALTRIRANLALWLIAGGGILVSLLRGGFSGREYIGFHWGFSAIILAGWLLFAWTYFSRVGFSLRDRPVYIYMWSTAIVLFVITFIEGHLYLFRGIGDRPLRDLAVQWKSYGTLVGTFNLLIYGSLMYIAERMSPGSNYARSNLGFSLFYLGVLNTFTNFGHHTYHVPQSSWVHWISFIVSMLEIIILVRVLFDILGLLRAAKTGGRFRIAGFFAHCVTVWTLILLTQSVLISIPPINALFHGTHAIAAHAMGNMLGIDSMVLFVGCAYLMCRLLGDAHPIVQSRSILAAAWTFNVSLFVLWSSFLLNGSADGLIHYLGASAPDFSWIRSSFPLVMATAGIGTAGSILWLISNWGLWAWAEGAPAAAPSPGAQDSSARPAEADSGG